MYRIPLRCNECRSENWVDLQNLEKRPLDKINTARGFICNNCEKWELVSVETPSLLEAIEKLLKSKHFKRQVMFAKVKLKALNLIKKASNGKVNNKNMAPPR